MCQLLVEISKMIADLEDYQKSNNMTYAIHEYFSILKANIECLNLIIPSGFPMIANFDYKDVKYNGFRSIFRIIKKSIDHIYFSLKNLSKNSVFNVSKNENEFKNYIQILTKLTVLAKFLFRMIVVQKDNKCLFLKKEDNEDIYSSMISNYEFLQNEIFYGECLGFYLCEPCQLVAKIFCSIQLGLGQAVVLPKSDIEVFLSTLVNSAQSLYLEKDRGVQMLKLFKQSTIIFCKQFWNLVDHPVVISFSHLVLPSLKVIKEITLRYAELLFPRSGNPDKYVQVFPPSTHKELDEVKIRLLSKTARKGMEFFIKNFKSDDFKDVSPFLLIHCHGGGFVAQSSQSHDNYLRQWAIELDCPIVSVDYSHAPEFPYPRAHEECVYAYAWVLKNLSYFGCSQDCKIIICGDSAGGNLALGCVLKLFKLHVRVPDAIFLAYPATYVSFAASPARMIGAFCPILPIGVLARCLLAYGGVNEDNLVKTLSRNSIHSSNSVNEKANERPCSSFLEHDTYDSKGSRIFYSSQEAISPIVLLENADLLSDSFMSPILADDKVLEKFPPMSIFASEFDPLLDDAVEFCKKVDRAGAKEVRLRVMKNLPHGFLTMGSLMTTDCLNATKECVKEIKRLFEES